MKRGRSHSAPSYQLHKATGQARVRINGKHFYLGTYGTEARIPTVKLAHVAPKNRLARNCRFSFPSVNEIAETKQSI